MTREAERRPGARDGVQEAHAGSGTTHSVTQCPLIAAALRIGEYEVLLAVAEYHPAERCPARQEAA